MTGTGLLRHRVTIQSPTHTPDGMGGSTLGWSSVATVWGRMKPLKGYEAARSANIKDEADYTLTIRTLAVPTVAGTMRVLWKSVPYIIAGDPVADEVGAFTTIPLRRGVPS